MIFDAWRAIVLSSGRTVRRVAYLVVGERWT